MAKLISEYMDAKNVKHAVEHFTLPADDNMDREHIIEDILNALLRKRKSVRA